MWAYISFLRDINGLGTAMPSMDDSIGIIAIELMAVSFRITQEAHDKDVLVDEIHKILRFHGWDRCVLVGHSYGTVISAHLLKSPQTARMIGPVMLVDPICFLLHLPDIAYHFTVRYPSHAKEWILWYFASMDIGTAHTLGRRFFWSQNVLWKEDLQLQSGLKGKYRDFSVVLSEKDDIVNVGAVRKYITSHKPPSSGNGSRESENDPSIPLLVRRDGVGDEEWTGTGLEVIWFDGLHHAQPFDSRSSRESMIHAVRTYSAKRAIDVEEIP